MKRTERQARLSASWRAPAAAALFAIVVALTGCQTPGPGSEPGMGPRGERNVQFTDFDGYLEFVARRREQEQISKVGALNTRTRETVFEENVNLETEGYVYPGLFTEFVFLSIPGPFRSVEQG